MRPFLKKCSDNILSEYKKRTTCDTYEYGRRLLQHKCTKYAHDKTAHSIYNTGYPITAYKCSSIFLTIIVVYE